MKFPKILLRGGSEFSKNQRGNLNGGTLKCTILKGGGGEIFLQHFVFS